MQRSARFEVSWTDGDDSKENEAGETVYGGTDFIILELKTSDMKRLRTKLDETIRFAEAAEKSDDKKLKEVVDDNAGFWTFMFHGRAHPQREDHADGTVRYPPSLLAPVVIVETLKIERWK